MGGWTNHLKRHPLSIYVNTENKHTGGTPSPRALLLPTPMQNKTNLTPEVYSHRSVTELTRLYLS